MPVHPYIIGGGREIIGGIPPSESWSVYLVKSGIEVPLQWKANKIRCQMGKIIECIFGAICGNKARRSLEIII